MSFIVCEALCVRYISFDRIVYEAKSSKYYFENFSLKIVRILSWSATMSLSSERSITFPFSTNRKHQSKRMPLGIRTLSKVTFVGRFLWRERARFDDSRLRAYRSKHWGVSKYFSKYFQKKKTKLAAMKMFCSLIAPNDSNLKTI